MTSLLILARDSLERAANPAYGVAANDEHAARLAAVIGPADVERFMSEVARLDDPANLTSYGWAWVLEFAISHNVALDRELLSDLCQRWDVPALKALVIEAAIEFDQPAEPNAEVVEWLTRVVERAAPLLVLPDDDRLVDDDETYSLGEIDTGSAEALLTALLVVGTESTINAARQLFARQWLGSRQLDDFVRSNLNDSDPLARVPWQALQR